ncbi:ROK family protein [Sedimentisphaera salicampi]|uniref:Glucokinase n=1 Tax=Sedimentisphaera salicampi TaxID=1941349 RepID=A0A1W6LLU2_9BACT|nr:ROK family protein [Sedimentisphaera salicampi]ARN56737.1 Glucokinase [Sedimentisphaera salicampi]OXU15178.1 Glucokinase [Sedimentisphaera salicampi]
MRVYSGIDLGGTNVKVGLIDDNFRLLCKSSIETMPEKGPEDVFERVAEEHNRLASENGLQLDDICIAGMGLPGPANLSEGILINPPNLPGFENCPVRDIFSSKLGREVVIENDANAACWAEYECGKGEQSEDIAFVTLGTGVGGGIVCDGHLLHGFRESAGEVGHIIIYPDGRLCGCGQRGCAEAYASASNTAERAKEFVQAGVTSSLSAYDQITSEAVFTEAQKGDRLALSIVDETAKVLALLAINLQNAANPERVIFAGGMIQAGDFLLDKIKFYFDKYCWPSRKGETDLAFSTLGTESGMIGAAAVARRHFLA